jgi:hypothetical protein
VIARRLATRGLDQVVNSASSALFSFGLLAASDSRTLGAITLQMTAVAVALGLARTACYEGLLMSAIESLDPHSRVPVLVGTYGAVAVGLISALTGWLLGLSTGITLAIALSSAVVMVFDGLRFASFLVGSHRSALRADLWWLVGTAIGLAILIGGDILTPANVAIAYACACATGFLWFAPLRHLMTRSTEDRQLKRFPDIRFGLDHVLQIAPAYVALIAGGAVSSLVAIGELRAALIVFSPLGSAIYAIRLALLRPRRAESAIRLVPRSAIVYGAVAVLYGAAVLGLFTMWGDGLGSSLASISTVLLVYVAIGEIGRFATQGFIDEARRIGALRTAIRLRGGQGLALVVLSVVLATRWGATGLGQARSIAYVLPLIAWLSWEARRPKPAPEATEVDALAPSPTETQ